MPLWWLLVVRGLRPSRVKLPAKPGDIYFVEFVIFDLKFQRSFSNHIAHLSILFKLLFTIDLIAKPRSDYSFLS